MGHFVKVKPDLGRVWFMMIATWAEESGCGYIEHFVGGWMDDVSYFVEPHLRFDREEDALSYVLVHGGDYSTMPPVREKQFTGSI